MTQAPLVTYAPSLRTAGGSAVAVLNDLRKAALMSRSLLLGCAIAGTAVANVPGMADAYNNWESIHSRLDTAIKSYIRNLGDKGKDGWIAVDHDAYADAVERYQEAMESLRGYVKNIAGIVDELGDAYRAYWVSLARVAAVLAAVLPIAAAMLATPYAPAGYARLEALGALATRTIALATGLLAKVVSSVAGGMSVYFAGKGLAQMFNLEPTGEAKIDFRQAVIDTTGLPSFQEPPPTRPGQPPSLPPSAGFEWREPKKDRPEPYHP
ncbi:hypothetical protein Sme01_16200 [Sphaerisporangium melleum]|uniref:Uncharacterized protein n=1 Tax=Sphaerisporangium melleum TaxID=321316 RepID=A0A917VU66_9ACTN|nr:hypothetical protein [Sphaerisporangium melleum]GGL14909.1 hypothetical protein GCM10007964_66180 [Sphaerisporangium melleum]GII69144.1 hypothetical protein Sme01_16200 [Sphaerisporangium melleum]